MILLLFVSCGKKQGNIPVPENLSVDNNVLTWDAIVGAVSYDIKIDDNVYTSEENKFSLPIADSEEHEISVRVTTTTARALIPSPSFTSVARPRPLCRNFPRRASP